MSGIGEYAHLVELWTRGPSPDDPEGGFTETWVPLDPPTWYCAIVPASLNDLERISGGAMTQTATHVLRGRYHDTLTKDCRITFGDRVFDVSSVHDRDQRRVELTVIAAELIGAVMPAALPPQPPLPHAATHQPGGTDPIGPQPPLTHAATHEAGGTDPITPQPPLPHAATHAAGGTDPIAAAPLPADVVIAGSVAIGTNPALTGAVRLANEQAITSRNAANTANVELMRADGNNDLQIGAGAGSVQITPLTYFFGTTSFQFAPVVLVGGSFLEFSERVNPGTPPANSGYLFLQDNGAGKSQLMIQFATGAPIAIATQV